MKTRIEEIIKEEKEYLENIDALVSAVKSNQQEITDLKKQIEDTKLKRKTSIRAVPNNKEFSSPNRIRKTYQSKEVNVELYKEMLFLSNTIEDLETFLPKGNDSEFSDVINMLMMELQKELVFYQKSISEIEIKEMLEEVRQEIIELENKKNLLLKYKESQEDVKEEEETVEITEGKKHLFFISRNPENMTNMQKTSLYTDISSIPCEYHEELGKLLKALTEGHFKQIRRLKEKRTLEKMLELKSKELRLFFDIIDDNHLIVIGAIVKKVNVSSYYRANLRMHSAIFRKCKPYIEALKENEEFIQESEQITEGFFDILMPKTTREKRMI